MARLIPSFEEILKDNREITEGELHLLRFLNENLDNNYEVFFQPYLNGDRPDIVIMRRNSGVLIIEVKDYNLDSYEAIDDYIWKVKSNNAQIKSPVKQAFQYKTNIFSLHVNNLAEMKFNNPSLFATVSCAVYFHKADKKSLLKLFSSIENNSESILIGPDNCELLSLEDLNPAYFNKMLHRRWLNRYSKLFSDTIYLSLRRYLIPPYHRLEEGIEIRYSPEQSSLILSKPGFQKIKGVAGCGKTLVLAKRAVNAHIRTKKPVLILTFNISLRNYIKSKISEVRENYYWNNFHILHFHEFYNMYLNNHGLLPENKVVGKFYSNRGVQYHTILIDEGQDFEYDWLEFIKNNLLAENGEYVIFADEKQNIYNRDLEDDKKPKTNITGRWNETLKKTHRLSNKISKLALEFQRHFWHEKYLIDDLIINDSQRDLFSNETIEYCNLTDESSVSISERIYQIAVKHQLHPDNIAILAPEVKILREIDYYFRNTKKEKTRTMFETEEIYKKLKSAFTEQGKLEFALEEIRRNKKFNFWMNPGVMKLSTIHSFKGWEINSVFLIIPANGGSDNMEELIYTAITRCRHNLFILDLNSKVFKLFYVTYF